MKRLLLALLLAVSAYGYDFSLALRGPVTATPGYPLYLEIQAAVTEGAEVNWVAYELSGPFAWELTGRGTHPSWSPRTYNVRDVLLRVDIPGDAAAGEYPVTLKAVNGGIERTDSITLVVAAPAWQSLETVRGAEPAAAERWRENFRSTSLCNEAAIVGSGTWEGNIWFYDGIRVFYQMADLLGEPEWDACAGYVRTVYRPYVLSNDGKLPGWRVFAEGLAMDYRRTGDEESRLAALLLAKNSTYANHGGGIAPLRSRETALLLNAQRTARELGEPLPLESQTLAFALGHVDQWFNPQAKFVGEFQIQPFMVGLTLEALIEYHERTPDPRVPPAVRLAVDGLWSHWVEEGQGFDYASNNDQPKAAPDLNLLIAPAFAWLWKETGESVYRERGEKVFSGGVAGAWLGAGKQFSQNYRWSPRYVEWASLAPAGEPAPDDPPVPEDPPGPAPDYVTREELNEALAPYAALLQRLRDLLVDP